MGSPVDGGPLKKNGIYKSLATRWKMSFRLNFRAKIARASFRSGAITMLVFCTSSWLPITCKAQTAADEDFAAHKADAEKFFRDRVTPFIKTYCIDCHSNKRPTEAGVNFSPALKSPGHAAFSEQWKKAIARVKAHDMPPEGMEQPTLKIAKCSAIGWRRSSFSVRKIRAPLSFGG